MRMRGVEKNISLRDAKFGICQPEVCVRVCVGPGVVVAVRSEGGGGQEGGVRKWVSGMSVFLSPVLQRTLSCHSCCLPG